MAILTRRPLGVAWLAVCLAVAGFARPALAQATREHEVRAAFIYNFTKFIDWPPTALDPGVFRICVVGDATFAKALGEMIAGESVRGRPMVLEDPRTPETARRCQILYVGRHAAEQGHRVLSAARQAPTLTVGDGPRFLEQGGAVRFLLEENRVRFDVNLPAVKRAGLKMDSKLLRVARRVEGAR